MALSLTQAQNLLETIIGCNNNYSYLGLSSTAPQPASTGTIPATGATFSNFNITEPGSSSSYVRIRLSGTEFNNSASGGYEGSTYIVSIRNTKEIHFTEAITDWGFYKYFFISTSETVRDYTSNIRYVGELVYDKYVVDSTYSANDYTTAKDETRSTIFNGAKTTADTFEARKNYLFVKDGDNYVVCSEKTFDEAATYYVEGLGVHIEANTVPLIRAGLLKISVQ